MPLTGTFIVASEGFDSQPVPPSHRGSTDVHPYTRGDGPDCAGRGLSVRSDSHGTND